VNHSKTIVVNGLPETLSLYEEHKDDEHVTCCYIDTDWLFPEVRDYLESLGLMPIKMKRSLTELLKKYGWPLMRGTSRAWHIRELEITVDRHLRKTESIEIVPFTTDTPASQIKMREKRKTQYVTPYLDNTTIPHTTIQLFTGLSELRDVCESHYLIPVKGLMYSSLRPKFELELLFRLNLEYKGVYKGIRDSLSIEHIWDDIRGLDMQIIKQPAYFSSYSTLLDLYYEFRGRTSDILVEETVERVIPTGKMVTMGELRKSRILSAIDSGKWMWAIDHRNPYKWYPVRPIEFSKSGKRVRVVTRDGIGHEKYISLTNLYSRPAENYYGKVRS